MAKTPKYPNPAFFRTKNNMDWKAQGENLKEVFDIAKDMLLVTDWKAFGARQKQGWIDFGKRVAEEAAEIEALIAKRTEARKAKDWATADAIRDALAARHIVVKDTPQGITWSVQG